MLQLPSIKQGLSLASSRKSNFERARCGKTHLRVLYAPSRRHTRYSRALLALIPRIALRRVSFCFFRPVTTMPPKRSPPAAGSSSSSPLSAQSRSESPEAPPAKKAKGKAVKEPKEPKEKKVKEPKGPVQPIHAHLPNNTTFPLDLKFEKPTMAKVEEGGEEKKVVRLSSWNICGIKACEKKVSIGLLRS